MIYTDYEAFARADQCCLQRDTGSAAKLQNAMARFDVKEVNSPCISLAVGTAPRENYADEAAQRTRGFLELLNYSSDKSVAKAHRRFVDGAAAHRDALKLTSSRCITTLAKIEASI